MISSNIERAENVTLTNSIKNRWNIYLSSIMS